MVQAQSSSSLFLRFLYEIHLILLTIVHVLVIPLLLLPLLPIYAARLSASFLSKWFRPDLSKLVVTRSSVMAVDDWTRDPRCNLVLTIGFEGSFELDHFHAEITERVIRRKDEEGRLAHPEMQQYYETWLGFIFWKWESNFRIESHMRLYDEENSDRPVTTAELTRIESYLTCKPFEPKKSPWEVLLIPHYAAAGDEKPKIQKSLVIFRLHHGIADGYSLLNLLLKEICQLHEHEYALPKYTEKGFCRRVLDRMAFGLKAPYELVRQNVECNDVNEWKVPGKELSRTWFQVRSGPIPLSLLKEVRAMYKVSFTATLIGGISGGIRNYFIKRGKQIPSLMHFVAPFPVPGHTTKLRNFFTFAFVKFPVGISDPRKRLERAEQDLRSLKKSSTPMINFMQVPIVGGLFPGMIRSLSKNMLSTGLLSNFPGPFKQCTFMGLPVSEIGFTGGVLRGNQGIGVGMLSYLGNMTFRLGGCQTLFPEINDLEDLLGEIVREFTTLRNLEQV